MRSTSCGTSTSSPPARGSASRSRTRGSSSGRSSSRRRDPGEAIHVGDHLVADVEGARGVGLDAVLIDRSGRHDPASVPEGVPVITSLDELLPIVELV